MVNCTRRELYNGSHARPGHGGGQKYENDCQQSWFTMEQPPHSVTLDAYWIDRTDVTNAMYAQVCESGNLPGTGTIQVLPTRTSYYGDPQYDNYPVIYVNWTDANTLLQLGRGLAADGGGMGESRRAWMDGFTPGRTRPNLLAGKPDSHWQICLRG